MTHAGPARAVRPAGAAALEQALAYALAATASVTPELMTRPTPCLEWDLRMLLLHASDSAAALNDGLTGGRIEVYPLLNGYPGTDPAVSFAAKARALLASCVAPPGSTDADRGGVVTIGDCPMPAAMLIVTGALEIAVHGWDIFQACGDSQPIPSQLAAALLGVARLLITAEDRESIFAAPAQMSVPGSPSDQLIAFLGRSPLWSR